MTFRQIVQLRFKLYILISCNCIIHTLINVGFENSHIVLMVYIVKKKEKPVYTKLNMRMKNLSPFAITIFVLVAL